MKLQHTPLNLHRRKKTMNTMFPLQDSSFQIKGHLCTFLNENNDSLRKWDEEELHNPLGSTALILNTLINVLTCTVQSRLQKENTLRCITYSKISSWLLFCQAKSVCDSAFSECMKLSSVHIFKAVTSIGKEVFTNCYKLRSITIPNSAVTMGNCAFSGCY